MADLLPLVLILVAAGMLAALFDCWTADGYAIRHFPRVVWLTAILLLPGVGALLWLASGKVRAATVPDYITSNHPAGRARVAPAMVEAVPQRVLAPDDDPEFLAHIAARVAEINRAAQRDAADLMGTGAWGEAMPASAGSEFRDTDGEPDLHDLPGQQDPAGPRDVAAQRDAAERDLAGEQRRLRAWEADLRRREQRLRRKRGGDEPPAEG